MPLMEYPTDWLEPTKVLVSKLRGQDVPLPNAIRACYQIVGVCLGQFIPEGSNVPPLVSRPFGHPGGLTAETVSNVMSVEQLEEMVDMAESPRLMNMGILPSREQLLVTALTWLSKWILESLLS